MTMSPREADADRLAGLRRRAEVVVRLARAIARRRAPFVAAMERLVGHALAAGRLRARADVGAGGAAGRASLQHAGTAREGRPERAGLPQAAGVVAGARAADDRARLVADAVGRVAG